MSGCDFVKEAKDYMHLVSDLKAVLNKKLSDGEPSVSSPISTCKKLLLSSTDKF